MLKLVDITKEYKVDEESILALHGVSIEFRKSEFVSILGPSGCGKTTLLNIVGGLDRYTSGDIQIDGISTKEYDDVDWDTYRNRKIGFVFQSYNLIPHMSVFKNVVMGLTLAGVSIEERKRRAMAALKNVGLENQARKRPNQLSGGQMQRVAIARALVNDPEIILADEPTGALDSESGIQVMDLLKEVSRDRLVIMVTHNPVLAEEYSTRIVYLKDGEVEGDTKPFTETDAQNEKLQCDVSDIIEADLLELDQAVSADIMSEGVDDALKTDKADVQAAKASKKETKKCPTAPKPSRWQKYFWKVKEKDKSSMKLGTAINLSFTNLLSKKGRTLLTSIAGSIGIIGIILVLALSTGVNAYVTRIEENALSQYPIEIKRNGSDLGSVIDMLTMGNDSKRGDYPNTDKVYVQSVLSNLLTNLNLLKTENDLESLKKFLDANFDENLGQVKYDYGTDFNVYSNNGEGDSTYYRVHPFLDVMQDLAGGESGFDIGSIGNVDEYAKMLDAWDEMSTNQVLLNQQYDLLGASRWPTSYNEIIVVLDEKNQLNDYTLFMLGLITGDNFMDVLDDEFANRTYSVDDMLNLNYYILSNTDKMHKADDGKWYKYDEDDIDNAYVEENGIQLKVVGVVRPKKGAVVTSINSSVAYTHALTEFLIERATQSDIVQEIYDLDTRPNEIIVPIGEGFKFNSDTGSEVTLKSDGKLLSDNLDALLRSLGVADLERPSAIRIYSADFASKDAIIDLLDQYRATGKELNYTDYLEMIMGYIQTMTNTVTGALIAFSAISLIVSTIMIAIIIYTSVLERQKEIGVLRSLGARKKDISRVFLAESSMIGINAGILGLIISAVLGVIGNVVLALVVNIQNLVQIQWWHCVMMLAISILLSMFAGFIPSRIASNKDPAIALRSE
jgi:putative ABC transport system permease protein